MVQGCLEVMRADDGYIQAARESVDMSGLSSYQIALARAAAVLRARIECLKALPAIAVVYGCDGEDEVSGFSATDFIEEYRAISPTERKRLIKLWEVERKRLDAILESEAYQKRMRKKHCTDAEMMPAQLMEAV